MPPKNTAILIADTTILPRLSCPVPPSDATCNIMESTIRDIISLTTAAVITVFPSLLLRMPNCISTMALTGTAVIDRSNPMNSDCTVVSPKRSDVPVPDKSGMRKATIDITIADPPARLISRGSISRPARNIKKNTARFDST